MSILQRALRVLPAGGFSLFLLTGLAQAGELTVVVSGVTKAEGQVMVALFNDPAGFPRGKVLNGQMTPAKPGQVEVVFKDLAPGSYAVSAYQDLNGNQRLDANMVGMPTEPFGFSRDAKGQFGPPKFDDAAIKVGAEAQRIQFKLSGQ